jgi:hypothetical protein
MVPMFMCGLFRSNFAFAIFSYLLENRFVVPAMGLARRRPNSGCF